MFFIHHEVSTRFMLYTLQSNPSGMCTSTNLIDPCSIKSLIVLPCYILSWHKLSKIDLFWLATPFCPGDLEWTQWSHLNEWKGIFYTKSEHILMVKKGEKAKLQVKEKGSSQATRRWTGAMIGDKHIPEGMCLSPWERKRGKTLKRLREFWGRKKTTWVTTER